MCDISQFLNVSAWNWSHGNLAECRARLSPCPFRLRVWLASTGKNAQPRNICIFLWYLWHILAIFQHHRPIPFPYRAWFRKNTPVPCPTAAVPCLVFWEKMHLCDGNCRGNGKWDFQIPTAVLIQGNSSAFQTPATFCDSIDRAKKYYVSIRYGARRRRYPIRAQ